MQAHKSQHIKWLTVNFKHNYPRMSRALECLSFLGMNEEHRTLFGYLKETLDSSHPKTGTDEQAKALQLYDGLKSSMDRFWNAYRPA